MKTTLWNILGALILLGMQACGSKFSHDEAGFISLQEDIVEKFGADAYYTVVNMSAAGDATMGYTYFVDKSASQEDLRQERWVRDGGSWYNAGVSNMQVDIYNPSVYKFQLGKEVSLGTLGKLITETEKKYAEEEPSKKARVVLAQVNTNNVVRDDESRFLYTIKLRADDDSEKSYTYDRNGQFLRSN